MGETAAVDFWRQHSAAFDMVLVTADGRLLDTPGLNEVVDGFLKAVERTA